MAPFADELSHPTAPPDWAWRLSVADVAASGPFSTFHNVDRTIALLRGNGFDLAHGSCTIFRLREPYVPNEFDGAATTHCDLVDGPVQDLNLMVHQSSAAMSLQFVAIGTGLTVRIDNVAALVVVDGCVTESAHELGYLDAVVATGDSGSLAIESQGGPAVVAVVSRHR